LTTKYEVMETKLCISDKFDEEPTIGHLESLLYYATQFEGVDSSTIIQLDDEPSTGLVEEIRDDLVAAPAVQPAEEAQ